MSDLEKRARAVAKEWRTEGSCAGWMGPEDYEHRLAALIVKHMNRLSIGLAVNELYELYSRQVPGAPVEKLWDKTIAIIKRTGREVSDVS